MAEKEYIERETLMKTIFPYDGIDKRNYSINAKAVYEAIKNCHAADVAPVVHGEWVIKIDYETPVSHAYIRKKKLYICMYCGKDYRQHMNFCGNCGVKMDGGKEATP